MAFGIPLGSNSNGEDGGQTSFWNKTSKFNIGKWTQRGDGFRPKPPAKDGGFAEMPRQGNTAKSTSHSQARQEVNTRWAIFKGPLFANCQLMKCYVPVLLSICWALPWTALYSSGTIGSFPGQSDALLVVAVLLAFLLIQRLNSTIQNSKSIAQSWSDFCSEILVLGRTIMFSAKPRGYPAFAATTDRHCCMDLLAALILSTSHFVRNEHGVEKRADVNELVKRVISLQDMLSHFSGLYKASDNGKNNSETSSIASSSSDGSLRDAPLSSSSSGIKDHKSPPTKKEFTSKIHRNTKTILGTEYLKIFPIEDGSVDKLLPDTNIPQMICTYLNHCISTLHQRSCFQVSSEHTMILKSLSKMSTQINSLDRMINVNIGSSLDSHRRQIIMLFVIIMPFLLVPQFKWLTLILCPLVTFCVYGVETLIVDSSNPFTSASAKLSLDEQCAKAISRLGELKHYICTHDLNQPGIQLEKKDLSRLDNWEVNGGSGRMGGNDSYDTDIIHRDLSHMRDNNDNGHSNIPTSDPIPIDRYNIDKRSQIERDEEMDPYFYYSKDDTIFPFTTNDTPPDWVYNATNHSGNPNQSHLHVGRGRSFMDESIRYTRGGKPQREQTTGSWEANTSQAKDDVTKKSGYLLQSFDNPFMSIAEYEENSSSKDDIKQPYVLSTFSSETSFDNNNNRGPKIVVDDDHDRTCGLEDEEVRDANDTQSTLKSELQTTMKTEFSGVQDTGNDQRDLRTYGRCFKSSAVRTQDNSKMDNGQQQAPAKVDISNSLTENTSFTSLNPESSSVLNDTRSTLLNSNNNSNLSRLNRGATILDIENRRSHYPATDAGNIVNMTPPYAESMTYNASMNLSPLSTKSKVVGLAEGSREDIERDKHGQTRKKQLHRTSISSPSTSSPHSSSLIQEYHFSYYEQHK